MLRLRLRGVLCPALCHARERFRILDFRFKGFRRASAGLQEVKIWATWCFGLGLWLLGFKVCDEIAVADLLGALTGSDVPVSN